MPTPRLVTGIVAVSDLPSGVNVALEVFHADAPAPVVKVATAESMPTGVAALFVAVAWKV